MAYIYFFKWCHTNSHIIGVVCLICSNAYFYISVVKSMIKSKLRYNGIMPLDHHWLRAGNSMVNGEFPAQRPVTRSFDVFFHLRLNEGWANDRKADDLRRHRPHYYVAEMFGAGLLDGTRPSLDPMLTYHQLVIIGIHVHRILYACINMIHTQLEDVVHNFQRIETFLLSILG